VRLRSLLATAALLACAAGHPAAPHPAPATAAPGLISTEDLAARLDRVVLVDVRQAWTSYLQSHLPGAVWMNVETLRAQEGPLPFQPLAPEQYAALFPRAGIDVTRPVVVYSAGDQLDIDATYLVWILASMGHPDVRLLDGGYQKWEVEGRALTQRYPQRSAAAPWLRMPVGRFATASLQEVRAALGGGATMLVDARPPEQFSGAAGSQMRRGHIPGAINHPWKSDLEQREFSLVWKPVEVLRQEYGMQGITPDRDIIVYCNSGTEASHVFFALKNLLGYPRVRIYTGSWTEWAEREELPVER
jgi:thiosulfate/3-mercaptopyruvate sulfurtransferase